MLFTPSINIVSSAAGGFDAATTAWITAVGINGGTVSAPRQTIVNDLIVGLKADSLFTKMDRLWLWAAEDQPSALTDIIATVLATKVSTPTFTTDRGFVGEDTANPTKYIDSNYNPTIHATTYTQNSAHLSIWQATNTAQSNGCSIGARDGGPASWVANIFSGNGTDLYFRINDFPASSAAGTLSTQQGHFLANRTGASLSGGYTDGSLFATINQASAAPTSIKLYMLTMNDNGSTLLGNSNTQAMASIGGGLTGTEITNFYNRLRTYMTAVGVP